MQLNRPVTLKPEDAALTSELHQFASKLAARQQPLGPDFTKVLAENLWELYSRSDAE